MVTYADKLKSLIKKEFSISFEEFRCIDIHQRKQRERILS